MFEGANVVVTGGSSGMGLATAKRFAALGANVAIVARDRERLESARREIEGARRNPSQTVVGVSADLSDFEQTAAAIEEITAGDRVPDVLVNTAGIILPGYFESMPIDYFEQCMNSGFYSVVYPTRLVAPLMMARGRGHIVNVSSVAGFLGVFGYTAYASAKYAVMGFSESLRSEMKPHGVRVSVVCPPDTDTPGLAFEKTLRPLETDVVCGNIKAIDPDLVAKAIVRGVEKNKYLIIPDTLSTVYHKLKGVTPGLFFAVTDGDVKKARAKRLASG